MEAGPLPPFGYSLRQNCRSWKGRAYLRLFGKPFAWSRPAVALRAAAPEPGDSILEIGSRTGDMACELATRGATVVGLDIDRGEIGREVPPTAPFADRVRFVVGDGQGAPFRSGAFDKVLILDCLEHLEDDRAAMAEIYRLLRPGGKVILTVPTIPGHPPHRVLARLIPLIPRCLLRTVKAAPEGPGRVVEFDSDPEQGVLVAETPHDELLRAFGHYRHYDEKTVEALFDLAGFAAERMARFQMLLESEAMHFHHTLRGLQSKWAYPFLRGVALLDAFLPATYPGVGLLAVGVKT